LEALCKRLEIELPEQRGSMHLLAVQSVRGLEDIPYLIKNIKQHRQLLMSKDVLFPVMLPSIRIPDVIQHIWDPVAEYYADTLTRRLILVFGGDTTVGYPHSIHDLPVGPFEDGDVVQWIMRMTQIMGWPSYIRDPWVDNILAYCQSGDEVKEIRPELLYPHLDSICKLLQSRISADMLFDTLYKEP
jgi:hypothetical protein